MSLTKDSISIDLEVLHETQPPIYKIGTRVSVVYDDGYAYPGAIVAEGGRVNTYRIRLDEGTLFTTLLPDNDVDIRKSTTPPFPLLRLRLRLHSVALLDFKLPRNCMICENFCFLGLGWVRFGFGLVGFSFDASLEPQPRAQKRALC